MTHDPKLESAATRELFSRTFFYLIFIGALLFVSAGTLAWPAAWIYLGFDRDRQHRRRAVACPP